MISTLPQRTYDMMKKNEAPRFSSLAPWGAGLNKIFITNSMCLLQWKSLVSLEILPIHDLKRGDGLNVQGEMLSF